MFISLFRILVKEVYGKISTWEEFYYKNHPAVTVDECHQALRKDIDQLSWVYNENSNKGLKLKSFRAKLNQVSTLYSDWQNL